MLYSLSLIDKAAGVCGSYYKLAKHVGLAESTISEIRKGTRRLPLDCVPILADVCRVDVHDAIDRVMLEHAAGTKREQQLKEILGKVLAGGVAAAWLFSYSGSWIGSSEAMTISALQLALLYIVLSRIGFRVRTALKTLRKIETRASAWGSCLPPTAGTANTPPAIPTT